MLKLRYESLSVLSQIAHVPHNIFSTHDCKDQNNSISSKCEWAGEADEQNYFADTTMFIQDQQTDWVLHLGTVGMAIRSTVNRQTGFTPNFLMLGREVLQPIDLMIQPDMAEHNRGTSGTYAARHREAMGIDHRIARPNLQQSKRRQKRDYDLRLEEKNTL